MFSISNPSLVHEAASVIASIALKLNPVEIVTPLNQREEKKLWLAAANRGVFRNPVFIYDKTRLRDIAGLERKLANAEQQLLAHIKPQTLVDSVIYELIKSRIRDASTSIDMAHNILVEDDVKTAYNTALKYGRPNPKQLGFAQMLASGHFKLGDYESCFSEDQQTRLKAMTFDANAICEQFQRALHYYGIEGWRVEIDECASAIDVRNKTADGTPRVVVPVDREVNGLKLIELIGHEIECHLRDSENAAQLFRDILGNESPLTPLIPLLAKPDDEMFYEGHAKLSDVAITGKKSLPQPFYTIAQDLAIKATPFCSVASNIYELQLGLGKSESAAFKGAWLATYRAFRGCTDTKNPHGYTFGKDYGYLAGFCAAQNIVNKSWLDYASLSLTDLSQLQAAGIMPAAPKYPHRDVAMVIAYDLIDKA